MENRLTNYQLGDYFFAYQFLTSGLAKVNIHHILDFPQILTVYNIHGI
jgi:hypothetical protein